MNLPCPTEWEGCDMHVLGLSRHSRAEYGMYGMENLANGRVKRYRPLLPFFVVVRDDIILAAYCCNLKAYFQGSVYRYADQMYSVKHLCCHLTLHGRLCEGFQCNADVGLAAATMASGVCPLFRH